MKGINKISLNSTSQGYDDLARIQLFYKGWFFNYSFQISIYSSIGPLMWWGPRGRSYCHHSGQHVHAPVISYHAQNNIATHNNNVLTRNPHNEKYNLLYCCRNRFIHNVYYYSTLLLYVCHVFHLQISPAKKIFLPK
jgi:hypothetical protein